MVEIVLFHHMQGLTPGVVAFADELRGAGHRVHTPDLFDGRTFASIDEGQAFVADRGFEELVERGVRSVDGLPEAVVYAGFSFGVVAAQKLAQTRPGARGALLFYSCVPTSFFGPWPAGVPVQIHGMADDPIFAGEGDLDAARALVAEAQEAKLFVYPGDQHYFADSSLPSYDADAAGLLTHRVLGFLAAMEARPGQATVVEVTMDCADAAALATFWTRAVGYVDESPTVDADRGFAWLHDPRGAGPHLCLLQVPEPKTVKNRMHLDLAVSGQGSRDERWQRVTCEVDRLRALGASVLAEDDGHHVTMADPEGNEFDVC